MASGSFPEVRPQQRLLLPGPEVDLRVETEQQLDQLGIEERHPHLERIGHAGAIDLGEHLLAHEGPDVQPLQALQRCELGSHEAAVEPPRIVRQVGVEIGVEEAGETGAVEAAHRHRAGVEGRPGRPPPGRPLARAAMKSRCQV